MKRIEIWDYHKKKQIVSVVIKKLDSRNGFEGKLQKVNLALKITKSVVHNAQGKGEPAHSHREKKTSLSTNSSLE